MTAQETNTAMHPVTTDRVVIVGAGPAGCTSALLLADAGVPVTLLERHTGPHPLPRAVHLDDEVTRTLHRIGVSGPFLARSRPGDGLRLLDARHRVMAEFRREAAVGRHGFPQANMFHQPDLEDLLFARVEAHPLIEFRRGAEVIGLDGALDPFTSPPVRVRTRTTGGAGQGEETATYTGRFVLGCDGAGSTVRDLVGVTMEDLGFTERWLVVDVRADRELDTWDGVEQVCDPARAATFMRVTGDRYRWEFQLHDGEDEGTLLGAQSLGELLRPWTGTADLDGLEIVRSAEYTFRARIASRFRAGRVFLLGDAAHLTPPFIGQGLAAGLRDSDNLAWKIAHVLQGRAAASLLDTYETERRPHAKALVRKAVLVGWAMTGGQDRAAVARRVALAVACHSARLRDLLENPSTPPLKAGALRAVPRGARLPLDLRVGHLIDNAPLSVGGAPAVRLDDVLRGRTAVLTARRPEPELVLACRRDDITLVRVADPSAGDPGDDAPGGDWIEVRPAGGPGPNALTALLGDRSLAVVVRPDRVIAAVDSTGGSPRVPWSRPALVPVAG